MASLEVQNIEENLFSHKEQFQYNIINKLLCWKCKINVINTTKMILIIYN